MKKLVFVLLSVFVMLLSISVTQVYASSGMQFFIPGVVMTGSMLTYHILFLQPQTAFIKNLEQTIRYRNEEIDKRAENYSNQQSTLIEERKIANQFKEENYRKNGIIEKLRSEINQLSNPMGLEVVRTKPEGIPYFRLHQGAPIKNKLGKVTTEGKWFASIIAADGKYWQLSRGFVLPKEAIALALEIANNSGDYQLFDEDAHFSLNTDTVKSDGKGGYFNVT